MGSKFLFDCLLIGEGNLLIECAEILIRHQCRIIGIVSPDQAIATWSQNHNLPYGKNIQNFQQLNQTALQVPCDYLFSIVNQTILDGETLALTNTAINYHDALLPAYAGINATSWAIINGEKEHGITWHQMDLEVDIGTIFKQVKIEIEPQETALTLNTKCYQAAIASFTELIEELVINQITVQPQNLQQRSYFSRDQKPANFGIIDFNQPATSIDNLVRGLNFGNYPNTLTTAKLLLANNSELDYLIVTQVETLATQSGQLPGTIVKLENEQLIVATATQDIALKTIIDRQKNQISLAELTPHYQLKVATQLPEISPNLSTKLVKFASKVASSETYWLRQLTKCRELSLPLERISATLANDNYSDYYQQIKLPFSAQITNLLQGSLELTVTALAVYLARLSNNQHISLGFDRQINEPLLARYVPCNFNIDLKQDFNQAVKTVTKRLALNQRHQTYCTDIIARYPNLAIQQTNFSVIVTQVDHDYPRCENLTPSHLGLIIDQQQATYSWLYNTQVLSPQAIKIMSEQWTTLLEGIVSNNQCSLAQLPLISISERQQILREWNNPLTDDAQAQCLHQLFEAKAVKSPQAVALCCQGKYLTYGELNQKADQLAGYLEDLGVKPETLVGICLERSIEMIIGLFAILKAGGAYLPLDPNYPSVRLKYLLTDAGTDILLTQAKLLEGLPKTSATVICLDQDWQNIAASNSTLVNNVRDNNLAYTIYTSGSTGNPKGVEIEHHSVVNTLHDMEQRWQINSKDSVLAVSSLSFDLSVYDIFGVLGSGGRVIIPQPENCPNPEHWLELIRQEKVTIWNSAPALMELLVDYLRFHNRRLPQSLRLILLSGDRISPNLVIQLQNLNPQLQIISLGGATEASIWSIYYPIKNLTPWTKTIPYGRPLHNQTFYILDQELQLVPIGVTGELYIGGVGVARGYRHRQELTATKFIFDPFSDFPAARMYKTGDLGRYLEDGNIEFLGRIDNQVKIRGVRVELGEIEATLLQHPEIKETVVAIANSTKNNTSNSSEQKSIVAYCVSKSPLITDRQLRDFLKNKLPKSLIPATFVFINALPLTPNGKVDRQALVELPVNQLKTSNNFLPPQDRLEWQLSRIWSRILNVKPIGRNDNFFELGGTSLLALRLFEQIQSVFGKNLPLATLFQAPTIAQLATLMLERGWSTSWSSLVSIQPHGEQPPLFCVHAIGGNVLSYRTLIEALGTERPVYGLQSRGLDGQQKPLTSVEEMVNSYLEEIRLIQPQGPYFLAGHSFGGLLAFEMARQLVSQGETVPVLALFDTYGPNYDEQYTKLKLSQWLSIHKNNLRKLAFKEKSIYLQERLEHSLRIVIPNSWQQIYFQIVDLMRSPEQRLIDQIGKINYEVSRKYIPTVYEGKITLFRAQARRTHGFFDPHGGWQGLALGGIDVYEVPGEHITMLQNPENSQLLAEKLKAVLLNATVESQPSDLSASRKTHKLTRI